MWVIVTVCPAPLVILQDLKQLVQIIWAALTPGLIFIQVLSIQQFVAIFFLFYFRVGVYYTQKNYSL